MQLKEARELISAAGIYDGGPKMWADLGCGSGLFTQALAGLLPPKSTVHAVDKVTQLMEDKNPEISIFFHQVDFERKPLPFGGMDGMLMANSMHYVSDAAALIGELRTYLQPNGHFIIVEYDSQQANQWVPFPLPFNRLQQMCAALGFGRIHKLGEKKSLYRQGNLYACLVQV